MPVDFNNTRPWFKYLKLMEFTSENCFFNPNPPREGYYLSPWQFLGPTNSSIFRRPGLQLNAMRVRDKLLGFLQCFANAKLAKKKGCHVHYWFFQGNLLLINRQVLRIPKLEEDYWEITVRFHMVFVLLFICFVMIYSKGGKI